MPNAKLRRSKAPPFTDNSIRLEGVCSGYDEINVLFGIDLEIERGSIFALLGPNGGGKSTLLKTISALLPLSAGAIYVGNQKIAEVPEKDKQLASTESLVQRGLCLIPEGKGIFPNLTVLENLRMQTLLGTSQAEVVENTFHHFPQFKNKTSQLAGTLSGGEQQMLSLSRALCSSPSILLLDELSIGLAPMIVSNLYEKINQVAQEENITVLVVEQSAPTIIKIAQKAAIMLNGTIQKIGDPAEINDELATAYLGKETGK